MSKSRTNSYAQIKSTPNKQKYLRPSFFNKYIGQPILMRIAWVATTLLCSISVFALGIKFLLNLIDGLFNRASLTEAKWNLLGMLSAIVLLPLSTISILAPNQIGGRIGRFVLFPVLLELVWGEAPENLPSLKDEIGPKKGTLPELAYFKFLFSHNNATQTFFLPKNRSYPKVAGIDGILIDSVDIPHDDKTEHYRIVFNASMQIYQLNFLMIESENSILHCNTRTFNYPGITKNDEPGSILDAINAGIAQVYHLANQNNWTNAKVEKNLHLIGHCMGGAIAVTVAAYFKEKHGIDLLTFADRTFKSYSAAMMGLLHAKFGLPLILSQAMSATFLYAGGDLDIDVLSAAKKLNPSKLHYFNLGHKTSTKQEISNLSKFKRYLGIGPSAISADHILEDGTTLTDGLITENGNVSNNTTSIFRELNITSSYHRVFALDHYDNHSAVLNHLIFINDEKLSAREYYKREVGLSFSETEQSKIASSHKRPRY